MTTITAEETETTLEELDLNQYVKPMSAKERANMRYQHYLWDATRAAAHSANDTIRSLDNAEMLKTAPHIVRREQAHLRQVCRQMRNTLNAMPNHGDQYPLTAALHAMTSHLRYGFRIIAMLIVGVPLINIPRS